MKVLMFFLFIIFSQIVYCQDVYINNFNYKYHTQDCKKVTKSYYQVSLKDALKNNYKPCNECNPPTIIRDNGTVENSISSKKHPLGYVNQESYTTSTGYVINVGDTLRLGIGSKDNGDFAFIWKLNPAIYLGSTVNTKLFFLSSNSGREIIVSEIVKPKKEKWGDMVVLMFKIGGELSKYRCEIESSIKRGELTIPDYEPNQPKIIIQNTFSAADEIKKMKELLDSGIINQEEFEIQKKKLLSK